MNLRPLSGIYIQRGGIETHINAGVTVTARLLTFLAQLQVIQWSMEEAVLLDDLYDYIHRIDL